MGIKPLEYGDRAELPQGFSRENPVDLLVEELPDRPEWQADGACVGVDPEVFFPKRGGNYKAAKEICAQCVVVDECLEYALERNIRHGTWGGKSEKQRRVIRRERHNS